MDMRKAEEVALAEVMAAMADGMKGLVRHEVTRKRDLDMNGRDIRADERYLRSAVQAWNDMRRSPLSRDMLIFVTVGGYDDDKRELWEIPEVKAFIARWLDETGALREPRLSPMTREVLKHIAAGVPKPS